MNNNIIKYSETIGHHVNTITGTYIKIINLEKCLICKDLSKYSLVVHTKRGNQFKLINLDDTEENLIILKEYQKKILEAISDYNNKQGNDLLDQTSYEESNEGQIIETNDNSITIFNYKTHVHI